MATQRKSTASGAPRKAAPAKKAAKKSSSGKSTDKAAPRKRSRPSDESPRAQASGPSESSGSSGSSNGGGSRAGGKKLSAMKVARAAAQQLSELTGRAPETVTGIQRSDEGWVVELEVVESRRIPDSTDILATYRVEVDEDGELMAYHRAQRYVRGKGGNGDGGGR
jgi:hypothetical protein